MSPSFFEFIGCVENDDGELAYQEGLKVDAANTTGAGYVFHGALAATVAEF